MFAKDTKKRLKELGLICPVCDSCKVTTLRRERVRVCQRCGEEWSKK